MTREEAEKLVTFRYSCTCGGFAWTMNGRPKSDPHMEWCKQKPEYDEWYAAMQKPITSKEEK